MVILSLELIEKVESIPEDATVVVQPFICDPTWQLQLRRYWISQMEFLKLWLSSLRKKTY
jgi:hypothetical protein